MEEKLILLVEDDPDDEYVTVRTIKQCKVKNRIDVTHDGDEATDYLFRKGKYADLNNTPLPELIILDLKLPKKNGIEVLNEIRNNDKTKFIPVIILTSSEEESDLIKSYESGANSYITKPVDTNKFKNIIQQMSLYWLLINENYPLKKL